MGESLYLAFFIWAVVYFVEFAGARRNAKERLEQMCGLCLAARAYALRRMVSGGIVMRSGGRQLLMLRAKAESRRATKTA